MPEEIKQEVSAATDESVKKEEINYEEAYNELKPKYDAQGGDLGAHQDFIKNITPLLEKLDANPTLVDAINDGKIDAELAQAVIDGKVNIEDAAVVTEAAKAVTEEVGKKEISGMTSSDIEALIEKKVTQTRSEMEEKAELKDFESRTEDFIESTKDFGDYAEEIDKWLDSHNISDIEVAYYAVKGQMSQREALKTAEVAEAERAKEIALNASGGASHATTAPDGRPLIDSLVGGSANPLFK